MVQVMSSISSSRAVKVATTRLGVPVKSYSISGKSLSAGGLVNSGLSSTLVTVTVTLNVPFCLCGDTEVLSSVASTMIS